MDAYSIASRYVEEIVKGSPCVCGFRSRCVSQANERDPHDLSVIALRADLSKPKWSFGVLGVRKQLERRRKRLGMSARTTDHTQAAIDHVIELWEVKRAYYRAMTAFENPSVNDPVAGQQRWQNQQGQHVGMWYPQTFELQTKTLSELKAIINSPDNLCLASKAFNGRKNEFLTSPHDLDVKKFRPQLYWYIVKTMPLITALCKTLWMRFHETGNVMFAGVAVLIVMSKQNFHDECARKRPNFDDGYDAEWEQGQDELYMEMTRNGRETEEAKEAELREWMGYSPREKFQCIGYLKLIPLEDLNIYRN